MWIAGFELATVEIPLEPNAMVLTVVYACTRNFYPDPAVLEGDVDANVPKFIDEYII